MKVNLHNHRKVDESFNCYTTNTISASNTILYKNVPLH